MKELCDWCPGDVAGLDEEGGFAVVRILSRSEEPDPDRTFPGGRIIKFRVVFLEIGTQFPHVPAHPGDTLELMKAVWREYPQGYPGGWEFCEVRKREVA